MALHAGGVVSKRTCIIANSPEFDSDGVLRHVATADCIIAADGAVAQLPSGVTPHIVCGDFDSHERDTYRCRYPSTEWIEVSDQDTNDLEKCIALALARGASEVSIVCGWGGRLDQALTTLSVMERYHGVVPIVLHHGAWSCRRLSGNEGLSAVTLDARCGDRVSVIPQTSSVTVSLTNVRWPLTREVVLPGSRGVSNEALGGEVEIVVHSGAALMCHESRLIAMPS
jgi:thiamine pyrophosphokinase